MIVITGTVRISPGALERARPAMERMIRASREEEGCIAYSYGVDVLDPDLIHVSEKWESRDALAAHFNSPHMAEWRNTISQVGLTDRDLRLFEGNGEPI